MLTEKANRVCQSIGHEYKERIIDPTAQEVVSEKEKKGQTGKVSPNSFFDRYTDSARRHRLLFLLPERVEAQAGKPQEDSLHGVPAKGKEGSG
jgi:hypothetical protein